MSFSCRLIAKAFLWFYGIVHLKNGRGVGILWDNIIKDFYGFLVIVIYM